MAAVVSGILLFGWYLFKPGVVKEPEEAHNIIKEPSIELKLASGEIIDLSSQNGNFTKGDANITNKNNSLEYSVVNTAGTGINTVSVPFGKDYKINLSDGSVVWMNSLNETRFSF